MMCLTWSRLFADRVFLPLHKHILLLNVDHDKIKMTLVIREMRGFGGEVENG